VGAGYDETCNVGDIGEEIGADLVGNPAERGKIYRSRIGTGAAYYQLRPDAKGVVADGVVIEQEGLLIDVVVFDVEELSAEGDGGPV